MTRRDGKADFFLFSPSKLIILTSGASAMGQSATAASIRPVIDDDDNDDDDDGDAIMNMKQVHG